MTTRSITCGNCGKSVGEADIICPHCGALIAAYASPGGAVTTTPEYSTPSYATPPAPANVLENESAPEPLFDTNITVEDLVESADSDHPVELLLANVPMDEAPPSERLPEPEVSAYPWHAAETDVTVAPPAPKRPSIAQVLPDPDERGETEAYLRKLHQMARYDANSDQLSKPVQTRSQTKADREENRAARQAARTRNQSGSIPPKRSSPPIMKIIVTLLWVLLIATTVFGDFSVPLFMLTIFLSWGLKNNAIFGRGRR